MNSQLWPGQYPLKNPLILSFQQTRVKRKRYNVIVRLHMAPELLPDGFWRLLCVESPIGFGQLIDWQLLRTLQNPSYAPLLLSEFDS
jgi:hypothetical protein